MWREHKVPTTYLVIQSPAAFLNIDSCFLSRIGLSSKENRTWVQRQHGLAMADGRD